MAARVLIVDDNAVNLKLARVVLQAAGYEVATASSAAEAEAAVRARRPDLILMDVQLPDVDGLTLTRKLKADPATRDIVVLALTAYAMKGDDRRAREAGCDGYLSKPVDTRALPSVVAEHLAPPAVLIVEDDPAFGKLLRLEVESLGLTAALVADLPSAREALAAALPRLVITDRRLGPGQDGLDFCRELKQAARTRVLPVVLLTGSEEASAVKLPPDAGPDLCLPKSPETLHGLEALLRPLLARRAPNAS